MTSRSSTQVVIRKSVLRVVHVSLLIPVALAITYYSVLYHGPLPDHPWLMGWNDKFLHVCCFGLLTLLVLPLTRDWRAPLIHLAASAVAIEAVQLVEPARTASLGDLAASHTGIALGALFLATMRPIARGLMWPFGGEGC